MAFESKGIGPMGKGSCMIARSHQQLEGEGFQVVRIVVEEVAVAAWLREVGPSLVKSGTGSSRASR